MPSYDIIVVGTSAGGVAALRGLVKDRPPNLAAATFVVGPVPRSGPSLLPAILNKAGPLPTTYPAEAAAIQIGHSYVAPPACRLLGECDREDVA